jgi:hypothetical protein
MILNKMYWPSSAKLVAESNFQPCGDDQQLILCDNIESRFFRLMLLTRCTEHGILYGPATNYRYATKDNLSVKNNLRKSMLDYAMSNGNEDEFNPKIALTFYQIERTKDTSNDVPPLRSISKETIIMVKGNKTHENCKVKISQTTAKKVSQFEYLKLCYILNQTPQKNNESCNARGVYDYQAILKNQSQLKIIDNKDLALYVRNNLRWKIFNVKPELTVQQNIWRVRSFLQTMTGTGISIIEGAHRLTLAAKLLTGMAIDDSIPYRPPETGPTIQLPNNSPIWGKANVQVLTERVDDNMTNPGKIIQNETLIRYQEYSRKVAEQKTHFIETTWRDWIGQVLERIHQDPNFDMKFTGKMFSQLPEPTPVPETDKYLQNYRTAIQHVADGLFDLLPARRLAETGKTGTKNTKEREPVIKEEYKKKLTKGKPSNYPHQFWAGVSAKMK